MDPARSNVLMKVDKFTGMYTNAPRGLAPAPILLGNVYLEHTGGYTAMRESKVLTANASGAQWWGVMSEMTYNHPSTVRLMPGLLLSRDGATWHLKEKGAAQVLKYPLGQELPQGTGYTLHPWRGTPGNAPTDALTQSYGWVLLFEDGSVAQFVNPFPWPDGGAPYVLLLTRPQGQESAAQVWRRVHTDIVGAPTTLGFEYYGSVRPSRRLEVQGQPALYLSETPPADAYVAAPTTLRPLLAEFHKNRVYSTGQLSYPQVDGGTLTIKTESQPNRVYYSGIIAQATDKAKPRFEPDKYFDVPFKISRSVTALVGVGPHLYIFGERELWLMSGDPDSSAQLDQIGDSIGTVAPGSVQQLSGTVYWLSDSGGLAARSGQISDVGEPVRDLLLGMDPARLSSSTDFKREQWWLSDGVTCLCYHAREGGWTQRQEPGLQLMEAGGQPYALKGNALVTLDGDHKLPMTVTFPYTELGEWRLRKVFQGLAVGLDLHSETATVENLSRVDELTATTQVTARPEGAGQVKLHTTQNGTHMQGLAVQVALKVDTQDQRGILRPPLTVFGTAGSEEMWNDEQRP